MEQILFYLACLGLILVVLGLIRLSMTIFGLKKLQALDTKFQVTLSKFGLTIETHYLGLACVVVGITMIATPCILSQYVGEVSQVYAAQEKMETTSGSQEGGYTVFEEEMRIDLQKREKIGLADYLGSRLSKTQWYIRKVLKHVEKGVDKLHFRHATSGPGIRKIELPPGAKLRRIIKEKMKVLYNPFTELLRRKDYKQIFADLLARKGAMQTYYVRVPITVGEGEEIWYRLEYNNAFQGRDFEWAGKVFDADTDLLTMHITFPKNKPFKSFNTYKKGPDDKDKVPLSKPEIETYHGSHILTWKIRNAKKGEIYYIKWEW